MKFNDILALAKNGYSPKDIKDLMSLAEGIDDSNEGAQDKKADEPAEPIVQKEDEPKAANNLDKELEYKNRLSELEDKNKELQEQIKQLQKANTNKPLPQKEDTTEKDIDDLFRSFM